MIVPIFLSPKMQTKLRLVGNLEVCTGYVVGTTDSFCLTRNVVLHFLIFFAFSSSFSCFCRCLFSLIKAQVAECFFICPFLLFSMVLALVVQMCLAVIVWTTALGVFRSRL